MTPYWTSQDGSVVVYCERFEDVIADDCLDGSSIALIHADPPYGQGERTKRGAAKRGLLPSTSHRLHGTGRAGLKGRDFEPFDPAPLLALGRPTVLWGAQRYASRLPNFSSWLWWDKRDGTSSDDNGDGELAWTNLGGPPRQFSHLWRGTCRASETGVAHLHPTQKPVLLSGWVINRAKLKRGDLLFVPFMGSGPDLPVAAAMGLRCVACEVSRTYCDVAIARLGAIVPERAAQAPGPLFARPT